MMARFPLEDYAATANHYAKAPMDERVITVGLRICDRVGQLWEFPGGFTGFLRFDWPSLGIFQTLNLPLIEALPDYELRSGPVLYVGIVLALVPGTAYKVMRQLKDLPGVQAWAAHRDEGRRWALRRIRRANDGRRCSIQ